MHEFSPRIRPQLLVRRAGSYYPPSAILYKPACVGQIRATPSPLRHRWVGRADDTRANPLGVVRSSAAACSLKSAFRWTQGAEELPWSPHRALDVLESA